MKILLKACSTPLRLGQCIADQNKHYGSVAVFLELALCLKE